MKEYVTRTLLIVLLITSFSSLVYEVVWTRALSHVFGTSAFAITTVLTVFMAGLALGALVGGRIIDRIHKKYQFLAFLEILIGITCLITIYLLKLVKHPYMWLYDSLGGNLILFTMALFILSFLILIVPTFLVGVAFPTVVKLYFNEQRRMGESVGHTYMFDTIGGGIGALLTGFFLVASFGFFKTSLIASVLNIACGIGLFIMFQGVKFRSNKPEIEREVIRDPVILILFFLSGFAALMFEVIWSRHISLIYGSSIYSFSIVLCAFLVGLGIGSYLASRYIDFVKEKLVAFAMIELLIGVFGMALVVVFPKLEYVFLYLFFHVLDYYMFQTLLFLVCFLVILIPTMLMGATLPVISAAYASDRKAGTDVGRLYSVNSFGSIFGSFFAGFIMIPAVGLVHASLFAGIIYITIALAFLFHFGDSLDKSVMKNVFLASSVIILLGFIFLFAFYQPDYTYKGVYYHGARQVDEQTIFESSIESTSEQVFRRNSPYGLVTVFRSWDKENIWLKNNGKTDASLADMLTQGLLSHLPIALHEDPADVLDIGMGGAFSLTSALTYDEVEHVDVVEIDPVVVEACRTVLAPFNDYALEDNRTEVFVADGRNFLFSTDRTYDVIISEPPNIWVSGVSNLFTAEFYRIVRDHLNEGGIFSQWIPAYEMNEYDYMIALKTLRSVFPYLYEFNLGGDVIVIASMHEMNVHDDIQRDRLSSYDVDDDINFMLYHSGETTFYYEDYDDYVPYERNYNVFVSYYTDDPEGIDEYIAQVPIVNTDDRPVLEFATMRNKYHKFRT